MFIGYMCETDFIIYKVKERQIIFTAAITAIYLAAILNVSFPNQNFNFWGFYLEYVI